MSSQKTVKGYLTPFDMKGRTVEQICKQILEDEKLEVDTRFYTSYEEHVRFDLDGYFIYKDRVYALSYESFDTPDIFEAKYNSEDNTTEILVSYYNGGMDLTDAIEEALNRLEE